MTATVELARRVAAWLPSQGMGPSSRAIAWGPSGPDWAAAFLGCVLSRVVVVPLEDAAGPAFAQRVQHEARATLAFVGRAVVEAARQALPGVRLVVLEELHDIMSGVPPARDEQLPQADDATLLEIVFTSGTTSEPKGVLLTHGNVLTILRALQRPYLKWNRRLGWIVRRRSVVTLVPLSHMFGQVVGVFVPLLMDLTSVFVATPGPEPIREAIRQERAWVVLTVPRFLPALRRHVESRARLPEEATGWRARLLMRRELGLRFCCFIVGGAALEPEEEALWRARGYLVAKGYGLTETAPIVTLSNPFAKSVGRVGKPLLGQEVKLSPEGEVLVRGANVTQGYLQGGEVRGVTDDAGWFHTGDLGEIDERGRLRIIGRSKDVIVTAEGLNVHARDVEVVLLRDARVRDAAVVGRASAQGDTVHAVLLLHPGADAADVVARSNAALPPYQRVRSWSVWPGADFPRTAATGKVKKRELLASSEAAPSADPLESALGALRGGDDARSLAELGLSSLETIELVSRLESEHQVVLDESLVRTDMTLAQLKALVASPGAAGPPVRIEMPRWGRAWWARAAGAVLRGMLAYPALRFSARPFVVEGREHVEAVEGPVLFVANHASYLDAPAFFAALPRSRRWRTGVAMATEPFHPLFTNGGTASARAYQWVRYALTVLAFGAFPLPRSGGFRGSLEYAGELVDHGWSVLIFPEGRMSPDGKLQPFLPGASLLAKELAIPVIPFRIEGLWDVLPPGRGWWPKPGRVVVRFAPARSGFADRGLT